MRFNSIERLEQWKENQYPTIHDKIFDLIEEHMIGNSACDLCCSTGLLGQRIKTELNKNAIGIDVDKEALTNAKNFGINIPLFLCDIDADNPKPFMTILEEQGIDTLIARRCISEIFFKKISSGVSFAKRLKETNVQQIFFQGRQVRANSNHPLKSVNEEIALFQKDWKTVQHWGDCALLIRRK